MCVRMARPLRIQAPGLTYHVVGRGVRRSSLYLDEIDRREFLDRLADVVKQFALVCHAYCEMSNHYHLAVTTTEANLSNGTSGLLKSWPSHDKLTFALSSAAGDGGYTLTVNHISGGVTGGPIGVPDPASDVTRRAGSRVRRPRCATMAVHV